MVFCPWFAGALGAVRARRLGAARRGAGAQGCSRASAAVGALGAENVTGVFMPSRYSADESREDAAGLAQNLGIQFMTIPIDGTFQAYLDMVLAVASATNKFIDVTEPFKLAKDPARRERLGGILYTCAEAVRIVLTHLLPFMPEKAAAGLAQLGVKDQSGTLDEQTVFGRLPAGTVIAKPEGLFPRKI